MGTKWTVSVWFFCFITLILTDNCPDGWVRFHESCYSFVDEHGLDFTEANHYCAFHHQSHLVVIETELENNLLVEYAHRLFKNGLSLNSKFWLGASDEEIEGSWVWLTNQKPLSNGYTHWEPGQPENGSPVEDCLCLHPPNFNWHDCLCYEKNHPLCEKNSTDTTETAIIG